jgi:hypothetical protein
MTNTGEKPKCTAKSCDIIRANTFLTPTGLQLSLQTETSLWLP